VQKLVEVIEGQVKSATEEGRCKPDSQIRPEKLKKFSGLNEVKVKYSGIGVVKLKYSGRRKDVTWRSKLECEVNRSLVGCVCVLCW